MKKVDFGAKLIEIRKAKGLTQDDVAEKCNITVRTIQRIESGKVKPRSFTIKVISKALDFDFFEYQNTSLKSSDESLDSSQNKHTILWYIKDLFNLKTNTMRKVSILTGLSLAIGFSLFLLSTEIKAQPSTNVKSTSIIKTNDYLNTKNNNGKIQVVFTNKLTFQELTDIKNDLNECGITINYKSLAFDDNNKLSAIKCDIDCNDGNKGSLQNTINKDARIGFYRDYSENSKSIFGVGTLKKIIVIDVSHGGHDKGTYIDETTEKEIVLNIANRIKKLYKSTDAEIILTRNSDEFVSLKNRIKLINSLNPEYLISLHVSSNNNKNIKGLVIYTSTKNNYIGESNILAEKIKKSFQGEDSANNIKNANFSIIKNVNCPASLIELGFLTNQEDRKLLVSKKGQEKIAKTIVEALH